MLPFYFVDSAHLRSFTPFIADLCYNHSIAIQKGGIIMKCPKCGREVADGTKFCGYCGASLAAAPAPAGSPAKAKPDRRLLLVIAAVILLLAAGAFALFRMRGSTATPSGGAVPSPDGYAAVYADGNYSLISLSGDHQTLPLGQIAYGCDPNGYAPEVQFSPDGAYVFFFTTDANGQNITLYRAECSRLTTDLQKNQQLYTTVATGSYYDLGPLDNGHLLLCNEDCPTLYFDGSTVTELPEGANSITFDGAGNCVYWQDDAIWSVSNGDFSSAKEIDSGINHSSVYFSDANNLAYLKDHTLYCIDSSLSVHAIAEHPSIFSASENGVYYMTGSGEDYTFSCLKDGSASVIAEHISEYSYPTDELAGSILSYIIDDTATLFDLWAGKYAVVSESVEESLERCAQEIGLSDYSGSRFFITDSYLYVTCDGAVFASALTDHTAGDFEQICAGVYPLTQVDDIIYCTEYTLDRDDFYTLDSIDLYAVLDDGGMYMTGTNISPTSLSIYNDGISVARQATGPRAYMIQHVQQGSTDLPAEAYAPEYLGNDQFLYSTGDALYLYDDKNGSTTKLADHLLWYWSSRTQDFAYTLGIYD